MRLFIKKLFLLAILLGLVVTGLNFLGVKAGRIYKDGAALVCETKREMIRSGAIHYENGKSNVLFMGTSRILAGINPTIFDELSGGETFSYNLALPALPIGSAYFVLEDYLERNPAPEYIVMELYINRCRTCTLFNYYASQGLIRLDEVISIFKNSPGKNIVVNYVFPFRMYKFFTIQYLFNGIFRPERLAQVEENNHTILNRMKAERGYYFIEEQALAEDNRLPENFEEERRPDVIVEKKIEYDPFIDPYIEKFFAITAEKGIKVLLIQPVYRENQCLQYEDMPLQFQLLLARYDHVYAAKQGWKIRLYENRFFSDQTHLNREGAQRFTAEIYKEFREAFPGKPVGNGD